MNWQTVTGERPEWAPLAVSKSSSQTSGDHWKRSRCWKLTWKALGNACSVCLVTWVPEQTPEQGAKGSHSPAGLLWSKRIKSGVIWIDSWTWLFWLALHNAHYSTVKTGGCEGIKQISSLKSKINYLAWADGKGHFFSQLSSKPGAEFSPVRTKIAQ